MESEKSTDQAAEKICPRCSYQRSANEMVPEWQCPNCQVVYAKYRPEPPEATAEGTDNVIVREELYPQPKGSPLPWLSLILLVIIGSSLYLYDYFRWPDEDKITLFTSDNCGTACLEAVGFFQRQEIEFIEKNIDLEDAHRARWQRAGGRSIPMAFFGAERIEGYQETIYRIALTGFKDRMQDNLNQTVILFSSPGCPGCKNAVELLRKHQIPFAEYDIREPENEDVYRELFGRGTPLIFVGNIRLDGYNKKLLEMALEQVELL